VCVCVCVCVCVRKNKTRGERKKYHIWQPRRLATGSGFSPIFHDTRTEPWMQHGIAVRVCVCVSLWECMFEQVSAHFTEWAKCNWFVWAAAVTTDTRPHPLDYGMTGEKIHFSRQREDTMFPFKTQPWAEKRSHVCYNSPGSIPRMAHFPFFSATAGNPRGDGSRRDFDNAMRGVLFFFFSSIILKA